MRLVRQLREELGSDFGAVQRVARRLGCGVESVRMWVGERDVVDGVAGPDAQRVRELEASSTYYAAKRREVVPSARTVRDAVMMQILMVLWVTDLT